MSTLRLITLVVSICISCSGITSILNAAESSSTPAKQNGAIPSFFSNLGIGGAVGWTHNLGRTRVEDVSVVNGIVRIDAKQNDSVRPWIEMHSWFWEWKDDHTDKPRWGLGPFFAVAPGAKFVDAIGGGIMVGRKYDGNSNYSFNVSIGGALEPSVKMLGDGINANQPLPPGETEARTKTNSVASLLIMFSVGYDFYNSETSSTSNKEQEKKASYEPQTDPPPLNLSVSKPLLTIGNNVLIGPQEPSYKKLARNLDR